MNRSQLSIIIVFLAIAIIGSLSAVSCNAATTFVAKVDLPNCWAEGVSVQDQYLFTTGNEETKGLWILDITDATRPKVVSTWGPYYGYTRDVAVQNNYAYVCDGSLMLVFDVSDLTQPRHISTLQPRPSDWPQGRDNPRARRVVVRGNYAYLASRGAGLSIVNITNPANPFIVGRADVDGDTIQLCVSANYAYLAALDGGVQIVSIADPINPRRVSEYRPVIATNAVNFSAGGRVCGVAVNGSFAYVLSFHRFGEQVMLTALDVSDPVHPQVRGKTVVPGRYGEGYYENIIAQVSDNGYAFVIARDTLTVIDIRNPASMQVTGRFSLPKQPTVISSEGVKGEWVPRTIEGLNSWFVSFYYQQERSLGYLIDMRWGLWVLDLSDLQHPRLSGAMPTAGEARVLRVFGNRAYLSDWNGGMFIFDISDPTQPNLLGQYYDGVSLHSFHGDGAGLLYVPYSSVYWPPEPGNEGSIVVMDVSNPAQPKKVRAIVPPVYGAVSVYDGFGAEVFCFEGRLYVTHRGELFIYNGGTREHTLFGHVTVVPALQQQGFECEGTPLFVRRYGNRVICYVASNLLGLSLVDVTDPAHPAIVGCLNRPAQATTMIEVQGDYAYIPHFDVGVWIVNVSVPEQPVLVSDFAGPGSPMATDRPIYIRVSGNTAWVADYSSGAYAWDISNPASPTMIEGPIRQTSVNQYSLDLGGEYLYRADVGAFEVYKVTP